MSFAKSPAGFSRKGEERGLCILFSIYIDLYFIGVNLHNLWINFGCFHLRQSAVSADSFLFSRGRFLVGEMIAVEDR
jgi:hypothetical protein